MPFSFLAIGVCAMTDALAHLVFGFGVRLRFELVNVLDYAAVRADGTVGPEQLFQMLTRCVIILKLLLK